MLENQPLDILSLRRAYEDGLDPIRVVDEVFRRIEALADDGIFLHLMDHEMVRQEAARLGPFAPKTKPLWGIPFAVKDNIDVAGAPTTAACPAFAYRSDTDATVVRLLREAGALLIGKTNLDQFATGLVGLRTPYPAPKNAIDPSLVPGGSSSGSAVAVAQGLVSFALGTDTAGSGRVPAALNNIVGLKPSLGAISNHGVVPACRSLDTVSIFALSAEDAYRVLGTAAAFDPADSFSRRVDIPRLLPVAPRFCVGVPDKASRRFYGDTAQAEMFEASLEILQTLGGTIIEIDFAPLYEVARLLYEGPWVAERHVAIDAFLSNQAGEIHPVTRAIIERAETYNAADAFRAAYRLQDLKRMIEPALATLDLVCVPSIPTFATCEEVSADPFGPNEMLGTYTNFVNLLDLCGIAVPMPLRRDGRPGSVTLLARHGMDGSLAALANALQRRNNLPLGATGWHLPENDFIDTPPAQPDELPLAVVGAHMSGLPLNAELTRLGARFLYAAKTAPLYKFYSLAGGPPFRPGLVREAGGGAIELEVWGVPECNFGKFIKGVPQPLSIGTLTLEDGATVKGFLCEPAGTHGARDITGYGGWRAFLNALETRSQIDKEPDHA